MCITLCLSEVVRLNNNYQSLNRIFGKNVADQNIHSDADSLEVPTINAKTMDQARTKKLCSSLDWYEMRRLHRLTQVCYLVNAHIYASYEFDIKDKATWIRQFRKLAGWTHTSLGVVLLVHLATMCGRNRRSEKSAPLVAVQVSCSSNWSKSSEALSFIPLHR